VSEELRRAREELRRARDEMAGDHAEFLAELTEQLGHFFEIASSDIERTSAFVEWFAEKTISHGYRHGVEDAINGREEAER
jgi:hypothetical protein